MRKRAWDNHVGLKALAKVRLLKPRHLNEREGGTNISETKTMIKALDGKSGR